MDNLWFINTYRDILPILLKEMNTQKTKTDTVIKTVPILVLIIGRLCFSNPILKPWLR